MKYIESLKQEQFTDNVIIKTIDGVELTIVIGKNGYNLYFDCDSNIEINVEKVNNNWINIEKKIGKDD